ncbi:hypothetical protein EMIT079MI2_10358 [Bacillus sp. IT-79MI2]
MKRLKKHLKQLNMKVFENKCNEKGANASFFVSRNIFLHHTKKQGILL